MVPCSLSSVRKQGPGIRPSLRRGAILMLALALPACSSLFAKSPAEQYETGVQAWREGRVREARIALQSALQAEPDHKDARLLKARIFLEQGDGVAAEADVARAREAGATPAETRHLLAHARLLQNDPRGAIQQAEGAAVEHASHAARIIGLAQLALGDQVLAMRAFDRAIAADPKNAYVWLDVARFRRSIGDLGPAISATDKAVEADPAHAGALVLRGELTRLQYGLTAAIPWFDRALEVDPSNVTALLERASTYGDMGRMTAMLADARAASAIDPDHPLPFFLQAALAARGRDFALARSLMARTGRAYDDVPAAMLLTGILSYEAQDFEGAAATFARLVERQPGNLKARRLLASARLKQGDAQGALGAIRTIAERPDADSYTLTLAADALDRQGDRAAAQRYRHRAARPEAGARAAFLWSNASHPEVRVIGQLLVRGDTAAALNRARALQASMPGAAEVHLVAGDVLTAAGNHRAAADEYRVAANLAFTEASAVRLIGALGRAGDVARADAVLQLFAAQNPRNLSAQLMLAQRALAAGHWSEAVARYERLRTRIGNGDAALLHNLAWANLGEGDLDAAFAYARRAWALEPANPDTSETLGWTLIRRGDTTRGLSLMLTALRNRAG